jgi:UDP-glucose 4-epimerase
MPKILVTGGAGYIGSVTTHYLLKRGFEVIVVDDLSRGHAENITLSGAGAANFYRLRLQQTDELTPLLAGVDAVVHFAAYIAVGESTREPALYYANNVGGTLSLLQAMARQNVKRVVFSSTAAVYGDPVKVPIPEDARIAPVSPYGDSKAMVEKILAELDKYRGLKSVALRYFNACGAEPAANLGEAHEPETHLIPLLFKAAVTGEPIMIFGNDYVTSYSTRSTPGDGTCVRDYIHVSDLAAAHIAALDHLVAGGNSYAFNVGTGVGFTVMDVLRAVEQVTGRTVPYKLAPRRDGDAAELVADSTQLRSKLKWEPKRSELRQIVEDAWCYFQRQV